MTTIDNDNLNEDISDKELMEYIGVFHKCIIVSKKNGKLIVNKYVEKDSRHEDNLINLIKLANKKYKIDDFQKIFICTSDYGITPPDDVFKKHSKRKYLSYCTTVENQHGWECICPDFTFYAWDEGGYSDFDSFCNSLHKNGKSKPKHDSIIWRGHILNNPKIRGKVVTLNDNNKYDFKGYVAYSYFEKFPKEEYPECINDLDFDNVYSSYEEFLESGCHISLEEQVMNYRYMLDVPGVGYSGRLKLLLFSGRLVFVVDRKPKEFFMKELIPWVHYVPVKDDMSDLEENFKIIQNDEKLENEIISNAYNFAISNLTQDKIIYKWYELLSSNG